MWWGCWKEEERSGGGFMILYVFIRIGCDWLNEFIWIIFIGFDDELIESWNLIGVSCSF